MSDHRKTISPRPTMSREPLPFRRKSWTIKGKIDGHTFHLGFGEYPDGTLGEIWIDASKAGSFARGVAGTVAKNVSMSLQCRADLSEVVSSLKDMNYPPNGEVIRGDSGQLPSYKASSLADWIAFEIAEAYLNPPERAALEMMDSDTRPLEERLGKVAGPPRNADSKGDGRPPE